MAKQAHIISREAVVGVKTLALCGKEWKVTTLWDDIPRDKPICRDCVDLAVVAMDEADVVITRVRRQVVGWKARMDHLETVIYPDTELALDIFNEAAGEFLAAQSAKAERKTAKRKAKRTCTCEWEGSAITLVGRDCPIHSETDAAIADVPVAPEVSGQDDAKD